jgi:hypothetical protein
MAGFAVNQSRTTDVNRRTGSNIFPGTFIAEVMENKDPQLAGRVWVFIPEFGGIKTEPNSWVPCSYASPFYGISPHVAPDPNASSGGTAMGGFAGGANQVAQRQQQEQQGAPVTTYGFWAIAPDVGIKVLCTFVNGNYTEGYWYAVVPTVSHGMIPANGAPDGKSPMMDFNPLGPDVAATDDLTSIQRQPYEPLVQQLSTQGIQEDPLRGPITSSSFRESPSRVFGISSQSTPDAPGHTFVMDDGGEDGKNKLIRIRSASGNQITMHDDTGMIYLINAQGTGWIELSPSGQIDVFGAAGINLATNGDINLHADKNVSIHAGECLKMVGMKATKVMGGQELQLHGDKTMIEGVSSLHVHSCQEMMITSFADIHMKAFNYFCLKGKCFHWNSCVAKEAEQVPPEEPSEVSGYQTTVARAPSKEPYKEHDGGGAGGGVGSGETGPTANDGNAFANGSGSPGGTSMGSFGGGNGYGVPGGVGAVYGQLQNTSGYKTVDIGKVTAGVSAMNNADYINNVTVHWTGNDNDTISGTIATMKQRNMGYNALYDPKTKTFYTQTDSLNLRTNGQLSSANGSNNTNTYHVALVGGAGTPLDAQDNANLQNFGKDLGNGIGKDVTLQNHGTANPGHKDAGEGAVMIDPLQRGLNSSTKTKSDIKTKTTATQPATSVSSASAATSKVVTPNKDTISPTTKSYSNITNASSATVIPRTTPARPITLQNATRVSPNTSVTSTYNPATTVNAGPMATSVTTKPATITVTKTTTSQAGPMSTPVKTTSTQTIDASSAAANPYLGRGGSQPVGADPALANVPTAQGQQAAGVFDSQNPADQAVTGQTPAQEASAALGQSAGQAPSSDLPAAPGGGNTGCFAQGDNCERPADQTGGGAGSDSGANGQGPAENGAGDGYGDVSRQQVEDEIRKQAIARGMDPDKAVAVARAEGLNKYVGDNGYSGGPYQLYYGSKGGGGLGTVFTNQTGINALSDRSFSSIQKQIGFSMDYAKANGGWQSAWYGARNNGISGY